MDELDRTLVERSCERLIMEYCRLVDFGEAAAVADLFTEDARWRGTDLLLEGRHQGQAPEIDGVTYITSGVAAPGQMVEIVVEEANDYDVAGQMVETAMLD